MDLEILKSLKIKKFEDGNYGIVDRNGACDYDMAAAILELLRDIQRKHEEQRALLFGDAKKGSVVIFIISRASRPFNLHHKPHPEAFLAEGTWLIEIMTLKGMLDISRFTKCALSITDKRIIILDEFLTAEGFSHKLNTQPQSEKSMTKKTAKKATKKAAGKTTKKVTAKKASAKK